MANLLSEIDVAYSKGRCFHGLPTRLHGARAGPRHCLRRPAGPDQSITSTARHGCIPRDWAHRDASPRMARPCSSIQLRRRGSGDRCGEIKAAGGEADAVARRPWSVVKLPPRSSRKSTRRSTADLRDDTTGWSKTRRRGRRSAHRSDG
jgi:hypothetical protein